MIKRLHLKFTIFLNKISYFFVYVYVCVSECVPHGCRSPWNTKEMLHSLELEPKLGPLKEQYILVITEPSVQSLTMSYNDFTSTRM